MWKRIKRLFDAESNEEVKGGDYKISDLEEGWMFNYGIETYTVDEIWFYDFGDGYKGKEFKAIAGSDVIYIYVGIGNSSGELTVSSEMNVSLIPDDVRARIFNHNEAPNDLVIEGQRYALNDASPGKCKKAGSTDWAECVSYTFEGAEGFMSIMRWGEKNLGFYKGSELEEYQVDQILPISNE